MGPENQQGRNYAGPEGLSKEGNPFAADAKPMPLSKNIVSGKGKLSTQYIAEDACVHEGGTEKAGFTSEKLKNTSLGGTGHKPNGRTSHGASSDVFKNIIPDEQNAVNMGNRWEELCELRINRGFPFGNPL